MKQLRIGDITIDAVIEREGPWRRPQDFFPAYDDAVFKHHLGAHELGIRASRIVSEGLGQRNQRAGNQRSDIVREVASIPESESS